MLILPSRSTRLVQPHGAVAVDPKYNAVSVILPQFRQDLVRKVPVSTGSNVAETTGVTGRAWRGTSTSSNTRITSGSNGKPLYVDPTSPVTVGCVFKFNQIGINQFLFSDMNTSGYNSLSILAQSWYNSKLFIGIRKPGLSGVAGAAPLVLDTTTTHSVLFTHVPNVGGFVYVDGKLTMSNIDMAFPERFTSTGVPAWLYSGSYPNYMCSNADIYLGYILNADGRLFGEDLSANPWQLFKQPSQRLYFDMGGFVMPTLASLTASNLTSGGARLTVA